MHSADDHTKRVCLPRYILHTTPTHTVLHLKLHIQSFSVLNKADITDPFPVYCLTTAVLLDFGWHPRFFFLSFKKVARWSYNHLRWVTTHRKWTPTSVNTLLIIIPYITFSWVLSTLIHILYFFFSLFWPSLLLIPLHFLVGTALPFHPPLPPSY